MEDILLFQVDKLLRNILSFVFDECALLAIIIAADKYMIYRILFS